MKKTFLLSLFFCSLAIFTSAQNKGDSYKKFKGDISLGYSRYFGQTRIPNGFLFSFEPKYLIHKKLAIGLRIEMISLVQEDDKLYSYDASDQQVTLKFHTSFLPTCEYYFTNKKLRSFFGAGAGIHVMSSNPFHEGKKTESKFGEMIRAGMEVERFRFAIEYNFVPRTRYSVEVATLPGLITYVDRSFTNSYLSIKLGYCFGGRKK